MPNFTQASAVNEGKEARKLFQYQMLPYTAREGSQSFHLPIGVGS